MASKYSMLAKVGADTSQFTRAMKNTRGQTQTFGKQMMKLGGMMAGAFSASALISFGKEAINLYNVQAQAEAKLKTALDGNVAAFGRLKKVASDLQGTTLFGDEATIEAMSFLSSLGMTESQIKSIIPLVQDFATLQKTDLGTAAQLIGKSFASSTNALSRYGIEISGAAGSSGRLEQLTEALNNQVGGQAAAAAKTGTGAVTQLNNAWGDFAETIGGKLAPALNEAATASTGILNGLNNLMNAEGSGFWKKLMAITALSTGNASGIADVFGESAKIANTNNKLAEERESLSQKTISYLQKEAEANKQMMFGMDRKSDYYKELIERLKTINGLIAEKTALQQKELNALMQHRAGKGLTGPSSLQGKSATSVQGNAIEAGKLKKSTSFTDLTGIDLAGFDEEASKLIAISENITAAINDMSGSMAVSLAEGIGGMVAGVTTAGEVLQGVLSMFLDFVKQIGTYMIKTAITVAAFRTWILGNPIAAIGIGVALVSFATAMQASVAGLGSNVPALAEGGLAFGPTAAIVGDNPRANVDPEVIAPLSKLQGLTADNGGTVRFIIEGDKLSGVLRKHNNRMAITG